MAARFYVYRSTADKLNDAFDRIAAEGDEVVPPLYHLGSRDWLVLVRRADTVQQAPTLGRVS